MGIAASAVSRVVGITTQFKDLRAGGVLFLPQRIAVFAQGASSAVYSSAKWVAGSAGEAGARYGYGSPIHLIMRMLRPANGDGVGTIPITIYPLSDAVSSAAATGSITPSGTQTLAGEYRVLVNNILSEAFVIPKDATVTDAIRLIQRAVNSVLEMPMSTSVTYGTVTAGALVGTGNGTLTALSVAVGQQPVPGVWSLECTAAVTNGGTFMLVDPFGTKYTGLSMTAGVGAATVFTNAGGSGLTFTLTDGTTDFAAGAKFAITVPATAIGMVSKWKGASANALKISISGPDAGITFAIVQPTGGLVNPSLTTPLELMGNVWESLVLNALNISDTTALDAIAAHGEGRWGTNVHMPYVAFTGTTESDVNLATVIPGARRTDRVNAQLVSPGSDDLPFVVAARQLARIAVVANENPPTDYGAERATFLTPGADGVQWDYIKREQAVKNGSSTIEVVDGVVNIGDVVTFWRPTGEEPPAFRYVVDIIKLQQIIFNLALIFAQKGWAGAPLIPDDQATVNPKARKPRHAKAAINAMIDSLALNAIISDPATAKKATTANISDQNPKRIDASLTVALSGNTLVKDIGLNFGFYYGTAQLAA